jgi:2'-5' RNA ligase
MTKKSLYFIAMVVPAPIGTEIREIQNYVSTHFHSKASLRSPPHITLVSPFAAGETDLTVITELIENHVLIIEPFQVVLDGFGRFSNRVIFVNVKVSTSLSDLARELTNAMMRGGLPVRQERREYHPHVTIAFKDLKPDMFRRAWNYFREAEFFRTFEASSITLLKHVDGRWVAV